MSHVGLAAVGSAGGASSEGHIASLPRFLKSHLTDASVGFALVVLWMYAHAYVGIESDANIYMGRVLADLDPLGVGRDLMFANDGQSSFSIYRVVAREMASVLGLGPTVALLSIINVIARFVAILVFVRTFTSGRALGLMLAAVCVLPARYTPWHFVGTAEGIPVPRALAEASVLLALAALCRGRYPVSLLCLAVGAAFHPIMALPGLGIFLIVLAATDRRWLVGAAVAGIIALVAGLSGLPIVSRLFATIDPQWLQILRERCPYLFLSLWPRETFGIQTIQIVTIVLGASFVEARVRRIFITAIVVAVIGSGISVLLGDELADLLVLQMQPWRALWLIAVLAPVGAGLCLVHLPLRGAVGQITLAALCAAWLTTDDFPIGPLMALFALGLWWVGARRPLTIGRATVVAAWGMVILFAALSEWSSVLATTAILPQIPLGMGGRWTIFWQMMFPVIPVLLFAMAWYLRSHAIALRIAAPLVALLGLVLLPSAWDVRTPARRDLDAAQPRADLVTLLASRPGEVLWLDGDEIWFWARRGNWNGLTQGGAIVFSRNLAMTWHARSLAMIDHGLATPYILDPWGQPAPLKPHAFEPEKIAEFCARADAPAWIVSPLEPGALPPDGLDAVVWSSGVLGGKLMVGAADVRWMHHDRFAVIPCAGKSS